MKSIYYFIALFVSCFIFQNVYSQENDDKPRTRRTDAKSQSNVPKLSARAQSQNTEQTRNIDNVVWLKEIYRFVDLTKENNAALYYPTQPIGDRMNLFTLLFKLTAQGKLKGYKYLSDKEVFTDDNLENFEEILKRYQILYTARGTGDRKVFDIEDADIPSNEVTIYMVKEAWYFDQATGTFNSIVLAICPLLVRDEESGMSQDPICWYPYENIRPYISRSMIMTSNVNNAITYTIDDFFRKRMYKGDIIKTTNLMNLSLGQQVGSSDPAVLKHAQDSIEGQLKFFEEKLWVPKDTTQVVDKKSSGKDTSKSSSGSQSKQKEEKTKTKQAKPEKSSTPTKSVRRTR